MRPCPCRARFDSSRWHGQHSGGGKAAPLAGRARPGGAVMLRRRAPARPTRATLLGAVRSLRRAAHLGRNMALKYSGRIRALKYLGRGAVAVGLWLRGNSVYRSEDRDGLRPRLVLVFLSSYYISI